MLSDLDQKDVWEGWLSSEINAQYFAELANIYRVRQETLTWSTLLLTSGTMATVLGDSLVPYAWIKSALAILATVASLLALVQQNQKRSFDCSDLHFRWGRLASDYRDLWKNMYGEDADARLTALEEKTGEVSRASTAFPNKIHLMRKWQDYVVSQHRVGPLAGTA
jgi:hypothetical protein